MNKLIFLGIWEKLIIFHRKCTSDIHTVVLGTFFTIPDDPIEFAAKECEELTQNPTKDLESFNNCMDSKMQAMGGMGIFLIFAVFFGFAGIVMLLPGILIFRRQKN